MDHDVHIKGVQRSSLIDYPGKISCVVFLNKCNFRCGFCHNPELVLGVHDKEFPDITTTEFMKFLDSKKKWIEAVCVTGGEPTMHKGLIGFLLEIKSKGFLVKLDTNGTNPAMVKQAIDEGAVDYIAMDIKNCKEKYETTCSAKVNLENIDQTIKIIIDSEKNGRIDYEFRSTILPRFHSKGDIERMAKWLEGSKRFFLQQFKIEESLVDDSFKEDETFLKPQLEEFKKILEEKIPEVTIRM